MKRALVEAVRAVVDADPPGWTRARLARELHVSPSEMSKLLSGTNPLSRERVEKIAALFEVTEQVRRHLLRAHTAAFVETHPELRERLEKADAYEDAVLHRHETEQRYCRLQEQQERLKAAHQQLLDRHQATERQLADAERTARQERQAHAGARAERDRARREAERLRQELEGQQASLRAARQEMDQLSEDLASARTERDQARQEAGRLHDELVEVRADLLQHQEEDQRRRDQDAVVAQALQTVEDALHQHHIDAANHAAA
ncbi:helix-turn-helix domain-containing protein, partial [Streptacidiphilus neutrinimicus]|uniref:helix-turn-helix domain-containing protein n=1 Tax=Streptacidiphilus neutrinimicus TaxID=105420 RepID=UPI0005AB8A02